MNTFDQPGEIPERIDLNNADHVARWSMHFGVPFDEVGQIVMRVGNSLDNVREHLLLRRSRRDGGRPY